MDGTATELQLEIDVGLKMLKPTTTIIPSYSSRHFMLITIQILPKSRLQMWERRTP
jgi:hypothetical protein